jgi:SAM-dependent methyltransferase
VPDEATLRSYYNGEYEVDFERYAKNIRQGAESILRDLKKQFPNRGRLLEVGCSYGGFLAEARRDGWEVAGVELSETAACYARDKLNLRVFTGSLHDQLQQLEAPYEVVALFHVIEHVPDPVQLLEQCRKLIRPGGLLVLKTPNVASLIARITKATWQWVSPPAHLYLYSPKTLALLLEKAGYQPITFRSAQGDANNNLFAIMSSVAKRSILWSSGQPKSQLRKSLPVRIVERTCESVYYPFGLLIDPWLERRLWQPELYAVASNASAQ